MADVTLESTEEIIQLVSVSGASQGDITTAVTAHNALATAHGLNANIFAALTGAASPSAGNVLQTASAITFDTVNAGAHIDWDSTNLILDIGTTSTGDNGALSIPTGIAGVYWGFVAQSANNVTPAYTHSVMGWGFNQAMPGRATNAAYPAISWGMEGRYWNGASYAAEVYLQYTPIGGAGVFRPMSFTINEASPYATTIDFPALINVDGINCDGNFTLGNTFTMFLTSGPLAIGEAAPSNLPLIHLYNAGDVEFIDFKRTSTFRLAISMNDSNNNAVFSVTGTGKGLRFDAGGDQRFLIDATNVTIPSTATLLIDSQPIQVKNAGIFGSTADWVKIYYPGYPTYANRIKNSMTLGPGHENVIEFALCSGNNTTVTGMKIYGEQHVALGATNAAIADADLFASSIAFHVDESGNNLVVRVKYANGTTLKTGTLALT